MMSFKEFLESDIGKSGAGHNKGLERGSNTFGDRRGGSRKNKSPMHSDLKAGIKVPAHGLMIGIEKKGNKSLKTYLGKVGEPKIKYSKLPSDMVK